jgi:ubiquinone/menaquinone biosynthesis C-methylase UbiE
VTTEDGQSQWQLARSAAELYERYLVPAVTAVWAADLVDRVALRRGERVLDVACGTGVVARAAAARVGGDGRVAAIDINPAMLAVARSIRLVRGATIEWHEGSALALPFGDHTFDVALCQLGLQFVPAPGVALAELRRVLDGRGRLGASVYSAIERNPATYALSQALDRRLEPGASRAKRAEHALANEAELRRLATDAGFLDVRVETVTKTIHYPSAAAYVEVQLAATPLASVIADLDAARREATVSSITADVAAALEPQSGPDGLSFPQEAHVVLARA